MPASFDRHARTYQAEVERSICFAGRGHDFFLQAKAEQFIEIASRRFPDRTKLWVLEIGCGVGLMTRKIAPHFGHVHGVEVSRQSVREAARAHSDIVSYSLYDGSCLPFPDRAFDLVLASCVLHHVPPPGRTILIGEALRVTKPSGGIAVFEHNPFNPLTRLVVRRCEFDRDCELLSMRDTCSFFERKGARVVERRYILLLPLRGRLVDGIERACRRVPLGAQYFVFAQTQRVT